MFDTFLSHAVLSKISFLVYKYPSYKKKVYEVPAVQIPDSGIRKMILHMIQLEPELRLSAENYLQDYANVVFPNYFSPFLHDFYCCWNPLHSDTRVILCRTTFEYLVASYLL